MKRIRYFRLAFLFATIIAQASWAGPGGGVLCQISTITALKVGVYDGNTTFGELKKHGDMGLGTLNRLDGEMVALGGEFLRVAVDGKVFPIQDSEQTPFAVVTMFQAEKKVPLKGIPNATELYQTLDHQLANLDGVYAVKIEGIFKHLRVRSVAGQNKPYPGLEEALKNEVVFDLKDVAGTLVGFRFPDYMGGVNVPGYHFHFIGQDRKSGGHLLDCVLEKAEGEIAVISTLDLRLPE